MTAKLSRNPSSGCRAGMYHSLRAAPRPRLGGVIGNFAVILCWPRVSLRLLRAVGDSRIRRLRRRQRGDRGHGGRGAKWGLRSVPAASVGETGRRAPLRRRLGHGSRIRGELGSDRGRATAARDSAASNGESRTDARLGRGHGVDERTLLNTPCQRDDSRDVLCQQRRK